MIEWSIQLLRDKALDQMFVRDFFNFLIAAGLSDTSGSFVIIYDKTKYLQYNDTAARKSNKNLYEIIDTYLKFDLMDTALFISSRVKGARDISFELQIIPVEKNKCLIAFESDELTMPDEEDFVAFVDLCKDVFGRFDFVYGGFRRGMGIHSRIPTDIDSFLKYGPNNVAFYSRQLVDRIGRNKLLSTPAYKVEELENGGIMLFICPEPYWCADDLIKAERHLGYR